jgi:hypothetical protein
MSNELYGQDVQFDYFALDLIRDTAAAAPSPELDDYLLLRHVTGKTTLEENQQITNLLGRDRDTQQFIESLKDFKSTPRTHYQDNLTESSQEAFVVAPVVKPNSLREERTPSLSWLRQIEWVSACAVCLVIGVSLPYLKTVDSPTQPIEGMGSDASMLARQYYGEWHQNNEQEMVARYRSFNFRAVKDDSHWSRQLVLQPRGAEELYFFNPVSKVIWCRFLPSGPAEARFQILPKNQRVKSISEALRVSFPPPGPAPKLPDSPSDDSILMASPTDFPDEVNVNELAIFR